ncbi:hybrid sensor histidine kinase/response regulator transcription factor [Sphingobacterium deserti]|uniref:histidine kinase n=1 Tax=Sphingobacterium deserti TaxID=1229276 RepID=A0A0B8T6X8_9SPHI|nr:hybrid sensor histidine kinase/response regulator transcription factor [Sphingobacterium deserti]KGE13220.1 two-component system sensor histidine kinase/response [Sphingobacterium deserti]
MYKQRVILFIIWSFTITSFLSTGMSQTALPTAFLKISTEDGLSHSTVYDIAQDRIGNMWFATADGLNKYDGYRLTVYRHNERDSNSLSSDYIRAVQYMQHDHLLIAGKRGITLFDIRKNKFRHWLMDEEIEHIEQVGDNVFYLNSSHTIYQFNPHTYSVTKICQAHSGHTFSFVKKYQGVLLVGASDGLYTLEGKQLRASFVPIRSNVQDIAATDSGLWIATEGNGLYWFAKDGSSKHYLPASGKNHLISAYIRRLQWDEDGHLWIGTLNGLSIYNPQHDQFTSYDAEPHGRPQLSHNSIRCIFLDKQKGLWLGTYFGGVNYVHAKQQQFGLFQKTVQRNSLNDNIIGAMAEGEGQDLWIGTNDGGVNRLDRRTGEFTYFSKRNGLRSNMVKALYVDGPKVYIGTHAGGLAKLDVPTQRITNYSSGTISESDDHVYGIVDAGGAKLWIGTLAGLRLFDKASEQYVPIPKPLNASSELSRNWNDMLSGAVYALYKDSRNRLWIGTDRRVYRFDLSRNELKSFNLADNKRYDRINCFLEDHAKQLWVGMHRGLGRIDQKMFSITIFDTENGLPNNNVYSILQDKDNQLWISTNKGIASLTTEPKILRRYTYRDGLQGDQFNYYAALLTHDYEIYMGGINGVSHFYPDRLLVNPFAPAPFISEFRLFGEVIKAGDRSKILADDISYSKEITLAPDQQSFTLSLAVSNFLSRQNNKFSYKLLGQDDEWVNADYPYPIAYANLPAGSYTFVARAANSDGKWSEEVSLLNIRVLPYWWDTWTFKVALMLVVLATGFYWFKSWKNKQKLKNELLLEKIQQEKSEELNQAKFRFFTNISHEFRTPLTLIKSPLDELQKISTDKRTLKQLDLVVRNANKLTHLVDQLMDYRRADLGVFALKVVKGNPIPQLQQLTDMFGRVAQQKGISLLFDVKAAVGEVWYDPLYFDLIFSNLLSNAFKFTTEGSVMLQVERHGEELVIKVLDTGIGMKQDSIDRVFDEFFQENHDARGTGVGLALVKRLMEMHHATIAVESTFGKGTTFTLRFSMNEDIYLDSEKGTQELNPSNRILTEELTPYTPLDEWAIDGVEMVNFDAVEGVERPRILIVDDNDDVLELLIDHFQQFANVSSAPNGEEALALIDQTEVDLIITDVMMPLLDGLSFCKHIKQHVSTSHIPVVMLTARAYDMDEIGGLTAGADVYVKKPFDLRKLSLQVRNLLQVRYRIKQFYSKSLLIEPQKLVFNELDRSFLEKAKKIVESNLDNISFSVDDFADAMAMSRSTLHLKMKAITGESTVDFIRKVRFSEASNLLVEGNHSVTQISTMVGFNTVSYFATSFKNYFGVSPSEYAKGKRGL